MNNCILAIYFYKKFNFHYIHYNYNNIILYYIRIKKLHCFLNMFLKLSELSTKLFQLGINIIHVYLLISAQIFVYAAYQ